MSGLLRNLFTLLQALLARELVSTRSQLIKFSRPVGMFQRVRMEAAIVFADNKCVYFSHALFRGDHQHGEVLVKMKFKKGAMTVRPGDLIDHAFTTKPACIDRWDLALDAM